MVLLAAFLAPLAAVAGTDGGGGPFLALDGGVPAEVLTLLQSTDPARRKSGIDQLEGLPGREPARLIQERLLDGDGGVRARAAQALGRLRPMEAALSLVERLGDTDSAVRAAAAEALGHFGALPQGLSRPAVAALKRALGDAGFEVRLDSLRALGQLLLVQAIPAAEQAALLGPVLLRVDDENVGVRRAAVAVLGRLLPIRASGSAADEDPAAGGGAASGAAFRQRPGRPGRGAGQPGRLAGHRGDPGGAAPS
jgi:HEAT repeat protein